MVNQSIPAKFEWGWTVDDTFTPVVLEFKGLLKAIQTLQRPPNPQYPNSKAQMRLKYDFEDIEVVESREPYEFPVFSFEITYTPTMPLSPFGALASSLSGIVPPEGRENPRFVEGQRVHMKWADCMLRRNVDNKWVDVEGQAWQFIGIEGYTAEEGPSLNERLVMLMSGKTEVEFQQAYYGEVALQSLPGYNEATEKLANGELIKEFEDAGLITRNEEGLLTSVGA
ncbi:hypothetical protein LCGC14_1147980 [marine sediment metagenome]|uniref:Uncharacterized protein n=1 Tax=marine sediment metagenome TaxID=412755 RepID=A0A0F9PEI1_9ZZZZ